MPCLIVTFTQGQSTSPSKPLKFLLCRPRAQGTSAQANPHPSRPGSAVSTLTITCRPIEEAIVRIIMPNRCELRTGPIESEKTTWPAIRHNPEFGIPANMPHAACSPDLCPSRHQAGGELVQIQFLLGHSLCKQPETFGRQQCFHNAVNDRIRGSNRIPPGSSEIPPHCALSGLMRFKTQKWHLIAPVHLSASGRHSAMSFAFNCQMCFSAEDLSPCQEHFSREKSRQLIASAFLDEIALIDGSVQHPSSSGHGLPRYANTPARWSALVGRRMAPLTPNSSRIAAAAPSDDHCEEKKARGIAVRKVLQQGEERSNRPVLRPRPQFR